MMMAFIRAYLGCVQRQLLAANSFFLWGVVVAYCGKIFKLRKFALILAYFVRERKINGNSKKNPQNMAILQH